MRQQEDPTDITIAQELTISELFTTAHEARGFEWDFNHEAHHRTLYNEEVIMILNQLEEIWTDQTQDEIALTLGQYIGCKV